LAKHTQSLRIGLVLQLVYTALYALLTLYIAAHFGATVRGYLSTYSTSVYIFTLVGCMGLGSSITHFVAQDANAARAVLSRVLVWSTVIFVSLMAILTLSSALGLSWAFTGTSNKTVVAALALHAACTVLYTLLTAIFASQQRYAEALVVLIIQIVLSLVFVYLNNTINHSGLSDIDTHAYLVHILALCYALPAIIFAIYAIKQFGLAKQMPRHLMQNMLQYAKQIFTSNLVQTLVVRSDIWFMTWIGVAAAQTGAYSIAALTAQMWWILPNQAATMFFTKASKIQHVNTRAIATCTRAILWYSMPILLLAAACSFFVVPIVLGEGYTTTPTYFLLLVPGVIMLSASLLISAWHAANDKIRINRNGSLLGLGICVLGYILFIPSGQAMAAATVSSIAYTATCLYYFAAFCKQHKLHMGDLLLPKGISPSQVKEAWWLLNREV
jgi:O-antigen/teichoic acid export membrane protein